MDGYIPIPSPRSSLERGCFDPLVATQTVGGQCRLSNDSSYLMRIFTMMIIILLTILLTINIIMMHRAERHCVLLKNTNCTSGHCRCARCVLSKRIWGKKTIWIRQQHQNQYDNYHSADISQALLTLQLVSSLVVSLGKAVGVVWGTWLWTGL